MRRALALVLVAVMAFAFTSCKKEMPVQEGLYVDKDGKAQVNKKELNYTAGDKIKWSYDEDTKTLKFDGEGVLTDVENFKPYQAFAENIVIEEGITAIDNDAFNGFSSVKSVRIAQSVAGIGDRAFMSCSSLEAVDLPISLQKIGRSAFEFCVMLTSISIPQNDKIYDLRNRVFANCNLLETAFIPTNITYITPDVFENCPKLTICGEKGGIAESYAIDEGLLFQSN